MFLEYQTFLTLVFENEVKKSKPSLFIFHLKSVLQQAHHNNPDVTLEQFLSMAIVRKVAAVIGTSEVV